MPAMPVRWKRDAESSKNRNASRYHVDALPHAGSRGDRNYYFFTTARHQSLSVYSLGAFLPVRTSDQRDGILMREFMVGL
jgi:hypothetical protein